MNKWNASYLDRYNQHGAPLCHAFGCRKHKRLTPAHNGLWCHKHKQELGTLRAQIVECKQGPATPAEVRLREDELLFRKWIDEGHVHYINRLKHHLS